MRHARSRIYALFFFPSVCHRHSRLAMARHRHQIEYIQLKYYMILLWLETLRKI